MSAVTCPKCAFVLPVPSDSCPKCGIFFAKYVPSKGPKRPVDVIVTTGDLRHEYEVIGPIFFQATNRERMLDEAAKQFNIKLEHDSQEDSWMVLGGANVPVAFKVMPAAFSVCVEGLKRMCAKAGGDAVVWMREDTDIASGWASQVFYMQAYGTAVRFR